LTEPKPAVRFRIGHLTLGPGETGKLYLYIRTDDQIIEVIHFTFGLVVKNEEPIDVEIYNFNASIPFHHRLD